MTRGQPMDPAERAARDRYTQRGLDKFMQERRDRGVPPEGYIAAVQFHYCDENCKLHDEHPK